jgi:hypothetical protein
MTIRCRTARLSLACILLFFANLPACHHRKPPDTSNQTGHYDLITHPDGSQERVWRPDPQ